MKSSVNLTSNRLEIHAPRHKKQTALFLGSWRAPRQCSEGWGFYVSVHGLLSPPQLIFSQCSSDRCLVCLRKPSHSHLGSSFWWLSFEENSRDTAVLIWHTNSTYIYYYISFSLMPMVESQAWLSKKRFFFYSILMLNIFTNFCVLDGCILFHFVFSINMIFVHLKWCSHWTWWHRHVIRTLRRLRQEDKKVWSG